MLDYFSLLLGAMVGSISLVVLLSLLIGKAYNERPLFALAVMGVLDLAFLLLGGAGVWIEAPHTWRAQAALAVYFVSIASSMLLPLLVFGQTGASRNASRTLWALAGLCLMLGIANAMGWKWQLLNLVFVFAWAGAASLYFQRNWMQGRPWIYWLALGQFMLWAAFFGKHVLETGIFTVHPRMVLAWCALHLMLFVVASYLALVWRSRLLSHERLKAQVNTSRDALTGLSIRAEFSEALNRVSLRTQRMGYTSGVLVLRAKNLAEFSTEMGSDNAELGIMWIARILSRCTRSHDLVARVSDQHFAVLIDGISVDYDVASLATKIVSHGLRMSDHNTEGRGLHFSIVAMPLHGIAGVGSQVLDALLWKLNDVQNSTKPIHLLRPDFSPKDAPEPSSSHG